MDPFVVDMHTRSGLLDAIRASTISLEDAGRGDARRSSSEHVPEPSSVPLCGNSIGMDRRFLSAYLPTIEQYLHYRSIDVSSVKELVKRWYPEVADDRVKGQGSHRALDDIRESVRELQYYRARVFRTETAAPLPRLDPARDRWLRDSHPGWSINRRTTTAPALYVADAGARAR